MLTNGRIGTSVLVLMCLVPPCSKAQESSSRRSVYTSIANKDCTFERIGEETGSEEDQIKRCPGLAGTQVIVDARGTTVTLGLQWSTKHAEGLVMGWSLGEKLEWRGSGAGRAFAPDSVTLRVLFNPEEDKVARHQVLAVLHVEPGAACTLGVVDLTADKTPYESARRLSDEAGAGFRCGRDAPRVGGPATPFTQLLLDRHAR